MYAKKTLKVASFFSGCGGMDLGFEGGFWVNSKSIIDRDWIDAVNADTVRLKRTDFETVFACDIKKSAKLAWEGYFSRPGTFYYASIVDLVKKAECGEFVFPEADVVTGGFPCQDFSIAGKRNGFKSHRTHNNQVDPDIPSIESRGMLYYWLRKAVAIIKPKIFIAENVKGLISLGEVKDIIINDFRTINGGYLVLEPKVLQAADYGVPQSRERIFFICIAKEYMTDTAIKKIKEGMINLYPEKSHDAKKQFVSVRDAVFDLCEPENSHDLSHQNYSKAKWYGKHCQGQTEVYPDGLAPTIRSEHHGNIEFRRLSEANGGRINSEYHLPQRRLSVRECARIQTFPDDFQLVTDKVSTSDAYKLVGNAVPPLLAYHVARQIQKNWSELFDSVAHAQQTYHKTMNKVA